MSSTSHRIQDGVGVYLEKCRLRRSVNSGFLGGLADRSGHFGEKDLSVHQRHQICDFTWLENWSFGRTHIGEAVIVVLVGGSAGIPGFGEQVKFVLV